MCLKERGGGARREESSRRGAEGGHPGGFAYSLASPDLNNEAVGTSLRPMAETYVRATTKVSATLVGKEHLRSLYTAIVCSQGVVSCGHCASCSTHRGRMCC